MKKNNVRCWLIMMGIMFFMPLWGQAQMKIAQADTVKEKKDIEYRRLQRLAQAPNINIRPKEISGQALSTIETINIKDTDIRDVFRGLAREYDINVIVDNRIRREITIRLSNISVIEALIYLSNEYDLKLDQQGNIFRITVFKPPKPEKPEKKPVVEVSDSGLLSFELEEVQLQKLARMVSEKTNRNIMVRNGVSGKVSGYLEELNPDLALKTLLSNNGFSLREQNGIYIIDRLGMRSSESSNGRETFWVSVEDGNVSMDVVRAPITDILREIAYQMNISMITYSTPDGILTAKSNGLTFEETLTYLFKGTNYTYRREGDIYLIGDKQISGIATSKLIRLDHIRADAVMEMIPQSIASKATIELVKEQNGLMVIGTNDVIVELQSFIDEIDYATPQILIETLVVDFNTTDMFELGVNVSKGVIPDSSYLNPFTMFGGSGSEGHQNEGFVTQGDGDGLSRFLDDAADFFGVAKVGSLPSDFYFRIQAMDREGVANIRSRPQISTLNGHPGSIEIGTTQYYILQTTSTIRSPNDAIPQESERFETIEANVSLEITPWVSASGEVTTEIHPEFNTPVGQLNAETPPTINSRVLDSTVRLQDGETIILGGLIQESQIKNFNKVPILGDIPLLGKLFRNRSTEAEKSELVIFITPHVFYGDGTDAKRWEELAKDLELNSEANFFEEEEE